MKSEAAKKMNINPEYRQCDRGSPARSMNRPREPDCAFYTVSYSDTDAAVFDVAFITTKKRHAMKRS